MTKLGQVVAKLENTNIAHYKYKWVEKKENKGIEAQLFRSGSSFLSVHEYFKT